MGITYIGPIAIEIHDEVLFSGSGAIGRWTEKVRAELETNTIETAPINKRDRKFNTAEGPRGWLKANIHADKYKAGRKVIGIDVVSDAGYSIYVIKGTRDRYTRIKKGLPGAGRFGFAGIPLPGNNYGKFRRVQHIRGLKANDFLSRGVRITSLNHSSLAGRGFAFRKPS